MARSSKNILIDHRIWNGCLCVKYELEIGGTRKTLNLNYGTMTNGSGTFRLFCPTDLSCAVTTETNQNTYKQNTHTWGEVNYHECADNFKKWIGLRIAVKFYCSVNYTSPKILFVAFVLRKLRLFLTTLKLFNLLRT